MPFHFFTFINLFSIIINTDSLQENCAWNFMVSYLFSCFLSINRLLMRIINRDFRAYIEVQIFSGICYWQIILWLVTNYYANYIGESYHFISMVLMKLISFCYFFQCLLELQLYLTSVLWLLH